MKKKIVRNISRWFCMGVILTCTACNDWLNVTPEAQVNDKKIFETPEGFQAVVNGIYVEAAKDALYGGELSYRFTDLLSQYYNNSTTSHAYYGLGSFDYKDQIIKPITEKIWLELYFCIANCNILLQNLNKVTPDFFSVEYHYNMIKGEALALRAFFHLDLLRLYAPAPIAQNNVLAIPYVEVYSNQITPHMTTQVVLEKIIRDLKEAKALLKTGDPISFKKELFMNLDINYKFTQPYGDDYFGSYRAYRMNYYAVCGLLARAYAYRNQGDDLKNAYDCAQEVIESELFPFVREGSISGAEDSRDAIFSSEILGCFGSSTITKNFESYTSNGGEVKRLAIRDKNDIFNNEIEDYRCRYLVVKNAKGEDVSLKYKANTKIPFIRLSELYYIQAQYLAETSVPQASELLELLRRKRGVNSPLTGRVTKKEELIKEIIKDAQKEFIGEGQAFYMYKRFNSPVLKGNVPMLISPENYIVPIPDVELEFGDRLTNLLDKTKGE